MAEIIHERVISDADVWDSSGDELEVGCEETSSDTSSDSTSDDDEEEFDTSE